MSFDVFDRVISELGKLKKHPALRKFIEHNKEVFSSDKRTARRNPVVLFELNSLHSSHIAYSYLANVLTMNNRAQIKGYIRRPHRGLLPRLIRKAIRRNEFIDYKSFGVDEFIEVALLPAQNIRAKKIFTEVCGRLNTKRDIEELTLNDVWVGDLIYDSFLMAYKKPTIDKESPEFRRFLLESIELFVFWEDYFDDNDVRAVNVSHCCYNLAMPLRIAARRNIPAFQATVAHVYRLSSKNLFAYSDFLYFRERFAALPPEVRKAGIAEAQRRIERRFAGEVGVDMAYSTKSAYGAPRHVRLLKESHRTKILIATHCFFDSPHGYGNNIFPDFYEWLDFLGRMTEVTDYDWYIKTHPDYLTGTKEIIDDFITKYPKFTLLPASASHHQIIAEGIDLALTVHGTIAFEYAALSIPVINCSLNNPHIAYNFNLHPRSMDEYRNLLLSLDELEFSINKQDIYEYYFMRYLYNTEDLFFDDYKATIKVLGGYYAQFTDAVYEKWLAEWTSEKHLVITSALQTYIQSGDFRMDYRHFGREFTMEATGARA